MALITAEAEYVASCSASCEAVWLRKLLSDIFDLQLDATCIHCDNQSCVKLSENPVFHDRLKHIEIKYHYIRDMVQRGAVKLLYVATEEQIVMSPIAILTSRSDVRAEPFSHGERIQFLPCQI